MTALSGTVRRGYASGGVATGTYATVPGLLLLPYLTDVIGIGAALAGLVVFLPKAWDFFWNPVAGRVSDRKVLAGGSRRPFLIRAGTLMALCFGLIFSGPTTTPGLAVAWVLVAFLACATAYAFFQVPYLAMAAEITDDYTERTRLMSWRVIVLTIAILVSGATAPLVVAAVGGAAGYRAMGWYVAALIAVGVLGVWWLTRAAPTTRHEPAIGTLADQLRLVGGNPHLRTLLTVFVLQAVATSMLLAGVAYAARHLLGDPTVSTAMFVAFVGLAVLVTPLWERFGVRAGKKAGYRLASLILLAGLAALLILRAAGVVPVLVVCSIVGIGYAGTQLFPLAMLPDIAAEDAARSGSNRIGMITGAWTGFELLGFALGPAIYGAILSAGGYVSGGGASGTAASGAADSTVHQPGSALWAITVGMSVVPAVCVAVSLLVLRGYRLDEVVRA